MRTPEGDCCGEKSDGRKSNGASKKRERIASCNIIYEVQL
jgi:hypothetical protein